VENNGIDFDPQYREEVFKPFIRLLGNSSYPGTGIGLPINQKITERHYN
jgi:light-regulated signal transduction histidine kinase (bacteriophytochrome)